MEPGNTVGLIGVGLMGTACAKRLVGAGFDVLGYDVDPAKRARLTENGGRAAQSVAEIAGTCRRIVLAVFTTGQVEDVIEGPRGVLAALPAKATPVTVICVSTCDPDRIAALAARLPPDRVRYVEAPVSGSSDQAA